MKDSEFKKSYFYFFFIAVAALLLAWMKSIHSQYPYFYSWDMDLQTTQDLLLMGSGFLPDHQVHPGAGLMAIYHWLSAPARALGFLQASSLEDLTSAVQPLLLLASATEWVRSLAPYTLFLTGLIATFALCRRFDLTRLQMVLLLFVLVLPVCNSVHLVYNRSEQTAILFLMSAWACLLALNSKRYFLFKTLLAGFFLGLAFYTKIQSLVLVAASVLLLLHASENLVPLEHRTMYRFVKINFWAFLILSLFAAPLRVTENVQHMRSNFGITPWWALYFAFAISAYAIFKLNESQRQRMNTYFNPLFSAIRNKATKESPSPFTISSATGLIAILLSGLTLSLAIHLFLYTDLIQSLRHLLLTFKIGMMGVVDQPIAEKFSSTRSLDIYLRHIPLLLLYTGTLIMMAIKRAVLPLLIFLLLAVNVALSTRNLITHDLIWVEVPILFFTIYFLLVTKEGISASRPETSKGSQERRQKIYSYSFTAILFIYGLHNLATHLHFHNRAFVGWTNDKMWYQNVYGGNQKRIKNLMDLRYPTSIVDREAVSRRIRNPSRDFFHWQLSLFESQLNLGAVGFLLPNQPIFQSQLESRTKTIAPAWLGATTYDINTLSDQQSFWYRNLSLRPPLAKEPTPSSVTSIAIRHRQHFQTALFVEKADLEIACQTLNLEPCPNASPIDESVTFEDSVYIPLPLFQDHEENPFRVRMLPSMPLKKPAFLALKEI